MQTPSSYATQLLCMLLSMFCWGSWANTMKLARNWKFQAFYWDYVLGMLATSAFFAFVSGAGPQAASFSPANHSAALWAIASGMVFNVANLLLVASIDICGLAVAFPVGIGLALILGVALNYLQIKTGNLLLLGTGVLLILLAIALDALAYMKKDGAAETPKRGIFLAIFAGCLMGLFYPILTHSLGIGSLTPATVLPPFSIGVMLTAIPMNIWMMRRPLTGTEPIASSEYTRATPWQHLCGISGGLIWCIGLGSNLLASKAVFVGPAVSYAIGQGATMISAAWGVFVWQEFRNAPRSAKSLIYLMFLLFVCGLALVALAPRY